MSPDVIVFDIGGTWFRSGVLTAKNGLVRVERRPSINYRNTPKSVPQLQGALVEYLVNTTAELGELSLPQRIGQVAISLGGAVNAYTGLVLNSGPLWGPKSVPLDLISALNERQPSIQWTVINDITAALMRHVVEPENQDLSKLMLLTVSTGVGCRIYDMKSNRIPVDRIHGLQGEIGHIPIRFIHHSQPLNLECDCGGANHLNAFCSGRGIAALIRELAALDPGGIRRSMLSGVELLSEGKVFQRFVQASSIGDSVARDILDSVTKPIAEIILYALTLDPEIEMILLAGGVIHSIGQAYTDSLLNHLDRFGMYQIACRDPQYFRRRIRAEISDDHSGLIGAGICARSRALGN